MAATAPVPDDGGELPAYSTAGLVAQVWMTNLPVAVVPPVPETPPAEPPAGLEEVSPNPCPAEGSTCHKSHVKCTAMCCKHCTGTHAIKTTSCIDRGQTAMMVIARLVTFLTAELPCSSSGTRYFAVALERLGMSSSITSVNQLYARLVTVWHNAIHAWTAVGRKGLLAPL